MEHIEYIQAAGEAILVTSKDRVPVGKGYSGQPPFTNNPNAEAMKMLGPIPKGWYTIEPVLSRRSTLGAYVLPLIPDKLNEMFGRSGFFIHGDSKTKPGYASHGCIILPLKARQFIDTQVPSRRLQVI